MRRALKADDKEQGILRFRAFFINRYKDQIEHLLREPKAEVYHALPFQFKDLMDSDPTLADFLMAFPDTAFPWAHMALLEAQENILHGMGDRLQQQTNATLKAKCKARLFGQLHYQSNVRQTVSDIRSKDVSCIIQIKGTVVRQSKAKLVQSSRKYVCELCGEQFTVTADILEEHDIEHPKLCVKDGCKSKKFVPGDTETIDFQEIHLQEQINKLGLGKIPRSIRVILTCDLSDCCHPGERVEVIGVVRYKWNTMNFKSGGDQRFDVTMYIEAISVNTQHDVKENQQFAHLKHRGKFDQFWMSKGNENPMEARNLILANFCPQCCGMYIVKLAVALTIIGGSPRKVHETKIRAQSHLLLVGDPGTGKSQLLRYAARMCSRSCTVIIHSVLTTGVGTTSAGLTVAAIRESGGEYSLEAGALVLADKGICCIDEFGSVNEKDRGVIHEAMEQQTISVAKGGFVCSLQSRATVLAAMNPPPGGFDSGGDLSLNTHIASSLLSRFDLLLLLFDRKNEGWDQKVGQHLMDNLAEPEYDGVDYFHENGSKSIDGDGSDHTKNTKNTNNANSSSSASTSTTGTTSTTSTPSGDHSNHPTEWNSTASFQRDMSRFAEQREERVHWTIDEMQAYFTIARRRKLKGIEGDARSILDGYYRIQRAKCNRDKSRTTIRLLESLVRLAEAHAKLMYRDRVLPMDAVNAVWIMEQSIRSNNVVNEYNVLQNSFPRNPADEFNGIKEMIFNEVFHENAQRINYKEWDYKQVIAERDKADEMVAVEEMVGMGMFDEEFVLEPESKQNEIESNNNNNNNGGGNEGNVGINAVEGGQNDNERRDSNHSMNVDIVNGPNENGNHTKTNKDGNDCVLDLSTFSSNGIRNGEGNRSNQSTQMEAVDDGDEIEYLSNDGDDEPVSGETLGSQSTLSHRSQLDDVEMDENYVPSGTAQLSVFSQLGQQTQNTELTQSTQPTQMTQMTQFNQLTQSTQPTQMTQQEMVSPLDPGQRTRDRRVSSSSTESEGNPIISSVTMRSNDKKMNDVSSSNDAVSNELSNTSVSTRLGQSTQISTTNSIAVSPLDSDRRRGEGIKPVVTSEGLCPSKLDLDDDSDDDAPPGFTRRIKRTQLPVSKKSDVTNPGATYPAKNSVNKQEIVQRDDHKMSSDVNLTGPQMDTQTTDSTKSLKRTISELVEPNDPNCDNRPSKRQCVLKTNLSHNSGCDTVSTCTPAVNMDPGGTIAVNSFSAERHNKVTMSSVASSSASKAIITSNANNKALNAIDPANDDGPFDFGIDFNFDLGFDGGSQETETKANTSTKRKKKKKRFI